MTAPPWARRSKNSSQCCATCNQLRSPFTRWSIILGMSSLATARVSQRVEGASRTGDERRRRLQERLALPAVAEPRWGGMTASWLSEVVGPLVADYVREARSSNDRLNEQLEHLQRRLELLDARTRDQHETRKILHRLRQLELSVALLRTERKK
jgi:hypothetical protein